MKKLIFLLAPLGFGFLTNSCKTDFETIAPYREMICVYGLLEHQSNANLIRLNRVFLTEGNAYSTAQNDDSVNYAAGELTVTLEKYKNGALNSTFTLAEKDTVLSGSGDFNTHQRLWQCNNQLASFGSSGTENSFSISYKLKVHNNFTGKDFSASTNLIKSYSYPLGGIIYISSIDMTNATYPRKIKWYNPVNGKTNNLVIRFHYKEFATSDTTVYTNKSVDWVFSNSVVSDPTEANKEIEYAFMGEDFYNFLKNAIADDASVYARKAGQIECRLSTIGEELQLFNDVNAPSNTIVQDKPIYTNITDGVGVLSSRTQNSVFVNLNYVSVDKLASQASPTCNKKFFDSNGVLGFGCQ